MLLELVDGYFMVGYFKSALSGYDQGIWSYNFITVASLQSVCIPFRQPNITYWALYDIILFTLVSQFN